MGGKMSDETMRGIAEGRIGVSDPGSVQDMAKEILELRSRTVGVRVKGLEWACDLDHPALAISVVGVYKIWANHLLETPAPSRAIKCASLEEAKAAAEADYRQRILSALETQEEEPWGYHNAMGQVFRSDELALQDEHVRSRFTKPLYNHPTPVQKEGEGQTVSEEMLERGIDAYRKEKNAGIRNYEDIVTSILTAALVKP